MISSFYAFGTPFGGGVFLVTKRMGGALAEAQRGDT